MVCFVMLYHHSALVLIAPLRGGEEMKLSVVSKAGAESGPAEAGWWWAERKEVLVLVG